MWVEKGQADLWHRQWRWIRYPGGSWLSSFHLWHPWVPWWHKKSYRVSCLPFLMFHYPEFSPTCKDTQEPSFSHCLWRGNVWQHSTLFLPRSPHTWNTQILSRDFPFMELTHLLPKGGNPSSHCIQLRTQDLRTMCISLHKVQMCILWAWSSRGYKWKI